MAADSARMDESVSPAPTAVVRSKTKQTANNALRGAQELAGSVLDAGRANSPRRTTAPAFSATIPAAHGTVLSATTLTARMAPCATRALQAGNRTKLGPRAKPAHAEGTARWVSARFAIRATSPQTTRTSPTREAAPAINPLGSSISPAPEAAAAACCGAKDLSAQTGSNVKPVHRAPSPARTVRHACRVQI